MNNKLIMPTLDLARKLIAEQFPEYASLWIHGDFAIGNILMDDGKLSAVIDFGGAAVGDPACDLVIAWTYLSGKAREIFISEMDMDADTWLRSRAWALFGKQHLSYAKFQIRTALKLKLKNELLMRL